MEYRDSEEHPAQEVFENPELDTLVQRVPDIESQIPSILRYFLDGSRKTYKVADVTMDALLKKVIYQ